mgnify:CR=1 FL=1
MELCYRYEYLKMGINEFYKKGYEVGNKLKEMFEMDEVILWKKDRSIWLILVFCLRKTEYILKKLNGESAPWTDDKILQEYKFAIVIGLMIELANIY